MSIENTDKSTATVNDDAVRADVEQIVDQPNGASNGLHHPDYLRASWMDTKVPGTDKVTVGDAMLYMGGALAVGAVAYGVYHMVKHLSDDHADAALIGGEVISL